MIRKLEALKKMEIGARVAEEESDHLERYFVETDQWRQMIEGNIDVIYGPKGSGKSAIYTLLNKKDGEFFDTGVLLTSAENVRGATVFRTIVADPPSVFRLSMEDIWPEHYCESSSRIWDKEQILRKSC